LSFEVLIAMGQSQTLKTVVYFMFMQINVWLGPDGKPIGGTGRLTKSKIDQLQVYYGRAT